VLLQSDLTGRSLVGAIGRLAESPDLISEMGRAAKAIAKRDAAGATADIIEELAGK
jgi:UDP-N-acetylglucosamine:LPS N-acetylglucosamine transferase